MSDLASFARRIQAVLSAAECESAWQPGEAENYMKEIAGRRARFETLATHLVMQVLQPRLETLASYFANASSTIHDGPNRCSCWFEYCDRFPSSTKVSLAVEHDIRIDNLLVCYEASMVPVFIKINEHDRMTLPMSDLAEPNTASVDQQVADWIERQLLSFIDVYLRIDRGRADLEDAITTDFVCGMRIGRSSAAASVSYRGHRYFFCSDECYRLFVKNPSAYVEVKPGP